MKRTDEKLSSTHWVSFDKWKVVRSLQILMLGIIIVAGLANLLNVEMVTHFFLLIFKLVNMPDIPIISGWVAATAQYYFELVGLGQLLQFVWLLTLFMVSANLVAALPELRLYPFTNSPLEDEREVVDRALHSKLYHQWIRLHFDAQAFAGSTKQPVNHQSVVSHQSTKSLANLIYANLYKLPASGYLCFSLMLIYYFSSPEAGSMDIVRRFVYLGFPLMIYFAGLLLTEITIYLCAVFLSIIDKK